MPRPRSFHEDIVLTAAMHVFRADGYTRASVARLEAATGLSVGSLYNAYGDKAGLYRAALNHYVSTFITARLDTYAGPDATLEDLERLFLSLFEAPLNDGLGCLVTNAAAEFAGSTNPLAMDGVRAGLILLRTRVTDVVARQLGPDQAEPIAARLVLIYQGSLVLIRGGLMDEHYVNAVRAEFARLRETRAAGQI